MPTRHTTARANRFKERKLKNDNSRFKSYLLVQRLEMKRSPHAVSFLCIARNNARRERALTAFAGG